MTIQPTIETEGSEFVQTEKMIVFHYHQSYLTLHQRPGTWMTYNTNREVTEKDKQQHEKWGDVTTTLWRQLIDNHEDYQLKPVISNEKDLQEVKES